MPFHPPKYFPLPLLSIVSNSEINLSGLMFISLKWNNTLNPVSQLCLSANESVRSSL